MAGCHSLIGGPSRSVIAVFVFLCVYTGQGDAQDTTLLSQPVGYEMTAAGPCAPQDCSCDCDCCCNEQGLCDTMAESIFGCPDPCCWRPLPLSTLFCEGWHESWVPSPNGSGGAPRQGWINAADGNMYRLHFFTFAQAFNSPPQSNAYLGGYTLLTPFSRRLMLITNIPFVERNSVSGGLPTIDPITGQTTASTQSQTTFGDVSFTPRVLLHETQDFSVTFDLSVLTPTGNQPLAGHAGLTPTLAFWYNIAGGWVVRGGFGDFIATNGDGPDVLISHLAIGQTITPHDVPLFGDFTYYLSWVQNNPVGSGQQNTATLTPGIRSHLGNDWYLLGGLPLPVTEERTGDIGMIFWFMKAW